MGPIRLLRHTFRPCSEATRLAFRRRRLRAQCAANRSLRVAFEAEGVADPGWVTTDVDLLDITSERDWHRVLVPGSIDALLAEHVWEHLDPEAGARTAGNCFVFRRSGGYLRAVFPDGLHPDSDHRDRFGLGKTGPGAHDRRRPFEYRPLSAVSAACGLQARLLEHFDESGRFVCRPWSPDGGTVHRSIRYDGRKSGGASNNTPAALDEIRERA